MSATADPIPVLLLTGFLGAGKTTFVNRVLSDPAHRDTAVVVNEFGAMDVDGDLVRTTRGDLLVSSTGCLCCTASGDIRGTLFDLLETARARLSRPFSRVIVETTGLADPASVINALTPGALSALGIRDHTVARRFRLASILTLVDGVTGDIALDRHLEVVKQVAFADEVLITKADLLKDPGSRRDLDGLKARIAQLNPTAGIVTGAPDLSIAAQFDRHYAPGRLGGDAEGWLAIDRLTRAAPGLPTAALAGRHADDITAVVLRHPGAVSRGALDSFLTLLQNTAGAEVLRVKGLVALDDDPNRPAVVHMVRHLVHPTARLEAWPSADRTSRLVVIGHGLDGERLQRVLDALAENSQSPAAGARGRVAVVFAGLAAIAAGLGIAISTLLVSSPGPGIRSSHVETKP